MTNSRDDSKQHETQGVFSKAAGRLNTATKGGLLGLIAGKVKFRDQMLIGAAATLTATSVWRRADLLVAVEVAVAIIVGGGLLILLRKWRVGAPRDSSDY